MRRFQPTCSGCWLCEGGGGGLGGHGGILDTLHHAQGANVVLPLVSLEPHHHVAGIALGLKVSLFEPK